MAGLAWKWPRTRLPVGASALGVFVLCWLYVFPVYRLPDEKEIVQGVLLQQGKAWRRNQTAVALFRYRRARPKGSGDGQRRESAAQNPPGRPPYPTEPQTLFFLSRAFVFSQRAAGRQAGPFLPKQNFFRGGSVRCGEEKGLGAGDGGCSSQGYLRKRTEVPGDCSGCLHNGMLLASRISEALAAPVTANKAQGCQPGFPQCWGLPACCREKAQLVELPEMRKARFAWVCVRVSMPGRSSAWEAPRCSLTIYGLL